MYRFLDDLIPLSEKDPYVLAHITVPDQKAQAIYAYNQALAALRKRHKKEALEICDHLVDETPSFAQAHLLCALILAIDNAYMAAMDELEDCSYYVHNLDTRTQALARQVADVILPLAIQQKKELEGKENAKRYLDALVANKTLPNILEEITDKPAEASLAEGGLLQKLLRHEVQNTYYYQDPTVFQDERRKTRRLLLASATLVIFFFALYFFYLRPQIILTGKVNEIRADKLNWLESELQKRAGTDPGVYALLADYQAFVEQVAQKYPALATNTPAPEEGPIPDPAASLPDSGTSLEEGAPIAHPEDANQAERPASDQAESFQEMPASPQGEATSPAPSEEPGSTTIKEE